MPVLLAKVQGMRLESVMVDVLHCVDLGIAAHIIGNIFWLCQEMGAWAGTTQDERVAGLEAELSQHYKDSRESSRLRGKLTVARLRTDGGWPKIKAKGAPTRHVASVAWPLAQRHIGPMEAALAQLLVQFYALISGPDMFLSDDARRDIAAVGLRICVIYSRLSANALAARRKFWKISPKLHMFQHLAEWQSVEYGYPKFYWTYADEDMVGAHG